MAATDATAELSWLCISGQHWGCRKCCPDMICPRHTRRRLLPTGSLWFDTGNFERVCRRGCVAVPGAPAHQCGRRTMWAGSFGVVDELPVAHTRILGGGGHAAAILLTKLGCEVVALDAAAGSLQVTGLIRVGGFPDPVPVHVRIPSSARVGDKLPCTVAVDVSAHWPAVSAVGESVAILPTSIEGCASTRYWNHRGAKQPTLPTGNILWHNGPAVLPPPERAGHIEGPDGTVTCVWCQAEHASVAVYAAACAHDCRVV